MRPVPEVVVTSYAADGALLGDRCVASLRAWPVTVMVYRDDDNAIDPLGTWRAVRDGLPAVRPEADKPENYIWNARKFAVKPFVWLDAAERLENGVLVWLDADTVVRDLIPAGFFDRLLGDASVAYLGRGAMHPETGFVAFRIPEALSLLRWCVECYKSGAFLALEDGWTDCHVLRAGMKATGLLTGRDLTSHLHDDWNSSVDAFKLSPLGPYIEHLKGLKRKREALTV